MYKHVFKDGTAFPTGGHYAVILPETIPVYANGDGGWDDHIIKNVETIVYYWTENYDEYYNFIHGCVEKNLKFNAFQVSKVNRFRLALVEDNE